MIDLEVGGRRERMIELELWGRRERIRLGLHICQFYSQPAEITHTAVPLLRDGLRGRDRGFFAAAAPRLEEARKQLRAAQVDVDAAVERGQLTLVDDPEALMSGGRFDPYHLLATHQALIARALSDGWQAVRCVIDMGWLAPPGQSIASPEQVLKYEAAADAVFTFQGRPIVALLQYNYAEMPGDVVVELLKLHPIAIVGRHIKRNPYYVNAEEYTVQMIRRSQQRRQPRPPTPPT